MILLLSYETGGDWLPIPTKEFKKLMQDPRRGKYLKRILSDGKVELFPGYTKEEVGDAVQGFLRERKLLPAGHYVLVEEGSDHRDS